MHDLSSDADTSWTRQKLVGHAMSMYQINEENSEDQTRHGHRKNSSIKFNFEILHGNATFKFFMKLGNLLNFNGYNTANI